MVLTNTFSAGTLIKSSEANTNFKEADLNFKNFGFYTSAIHGICAFSSTNFSLVDSAGDINTSTDGGITWTSKNTDPTASSLIRKCKDNTTKGFVYQIDTAVAAKTVYTSDSGVTWTTKTDGAWGTGANDLSFPTTNLIVVGGNDGGGAKHIVLSTDQGTTWTDSTTSPSAAIACVDMLNGTTGYAVDTSGNIWKTTNGAVDWTDTTHNVANTPASHKLASIYAVSATTCIFAYNGYLEFYDNTAGTSTNKAFVGLAGSVYSNGIIKSTNGKYFAAFGAESTSASVHHSALLISTTSGTGWALVGKPGTSGTFVLDSSSRKGCLSEYSTDFIIHLDAGAKIIYKYLSP